MIPTIKRGFVFVALILLPGSTSHARGLATSIKTPPNGQADTHVHAKPRESAKSKSAPQPSSPSEGKLLSDQWYTITLKKKIPYGYYNDRLEERKGKLFFQNKVWKKEEDYVNEEALGALAENTPELAPLFFNFRSTYRTTETIIDGNVQNGSQLTVKVRQGDQELPVAKRPVVKGTILAGFFPVWIQRKAASLKPGQWVSFTSILEDNLEASFSTVAGKVVLDKPDEFAQSSGTRKLRVDYRGMLSHWYIDSSGNTIRIEIPSQSVTVDRVEKDKALHFLD